jgi:histidinol-phosphate aminotransferase
MRKVKDSYNIDVLSTLAGAAALADQPYFRETVAKIRAERRFLSEQLRQMGLEVYPSRSNFVMARFRQPSAREVLDELKRRHILVRHYNIPGVQDCLRISIGAHEQMERLAAELKSML